MASTCHECGQSYKRRREDQSFCSSKCNGLARNREMSRAATIYRALYWWRFKRSSKHAADDLRFVCRSIAAWIDEDKAAGRGAPPRHNHGKDLGYVRKKRPVAPRSEDTHEMAPKFVRWGQELERL